MSGFVYILKDSKDKFYVGSTNDLERRLKQHHNGYTQTTHNMVVPVLVLFQEYDTLRQARKIERKIKNFKRKDFIEKMVNDGFIKLK